MLRSHRLVWPLLAVLSLWLPATAQTLIPEYGQAERVDAVSMPLTFGVAGWGGQAFTGGTRAVGRVTNREQQPLERFTGSFDRDGWFGQVVLTDTHSMRTNWIQTTATAVANSTSYIRDHNPSLRDGGALDHGQMEIRYIVADISDGGVAHSCVTFYGAIQRWSATGLICGPANLRMERATAKALISALGYPDVFTAVPVTLPEAVR